MSFNHAWHFTLTQEVPGWSTPVGGTPTVPSMVAGSIETAEQRRLVGYVGPNGFPGRERKFGIQQGASPTFNVSTMTYAEAQLAALDIWQSGPSTRTSQPGMALMWFDAIFTLGQSEARYIKRQVDAALTDPTAVNLFAELHIDLLKLKSSQNALLQPRLQSLIDRVNAARSYALSMM